MNEREQFEAWAVEYHNILRSTNECYEYQSQVTEIKWHAWQACAESKQSELDKANEQIAQLEELTDRSGRHISDLAYENGNLKSRIDALDKTARASALRGAADWFESSPEANAMRIRDILNEMAGDIK